MKNTCQQIDCPVAPGQIIADENGESWMVATVLPSISGIRLVPVDNNAPYRLSVVASYEEVAAWVK